MLNKTKIVATAKTVGKTAARIATTPVLSPLDVAVIGATAVVSTPVGIVVGTAYAGVLMVGPTIRASWNARHVVNRARIPSKTTR